LIQPLIADTTAAASASALPDFQFRDVYTCYPPLSITSAVLFYLFIYLFKYFWINTGHHKDLDTVGKQNEPGVEAELNFEFFGLTIISSK